MFVPYDQLSDQVGPLSRLDPEDAGIVVVESLWKAARRPYHKQKLAFVLSNLRHFALEQAARGVAVRHVVSAGSYGTALRPLAHELGGLVMMRAAERELRRDLEPLVNEGLIEVLPHEGWLTEPQDFEASQRRRPWRMDKFYRYVRRRSGILMEGGKPAGGRWSFDVENRQQWDGTPPAPEPPLFPVDPIKQEVGERVDESFETHPGEIDLDALPATLQDAETAWRWALERCLPHFGPYEDAMSVVSSGLFHSRISPLVNVHRLLPARLVEDVAVSGAPIQSREGFVRQVLGWREFVRHVHERTDGFREVGNTAVVFHDAPGDGGYARWLEFRGQRRKDAPLPGPVASPGARADESGEALQSDGGAEPLALGPGRPLPLAWWGAESGLRCLDRVVEDVWREAWSHHITRLMILGNLATLLDVSPREITDWFWVAYADAYDWVVEPNVLGMATFSAGDLMTTKPYVSGSAYINRMSDYCEGCAFNPKLDCPITGLYWAFLARHRDRLVDNPRMRLPLASLEKRSSGKRERDLRIHDWVSEALGRGLRLEPSAHPDHKSEEPG